MFKIFIFVVAIVAIVSCMPTVNDEEAPVKPGYCRIGDSYIKEGEQGPAPLGECARVTCDSADPSNTQVSSVLCPTFIPRKGCHKSKTDYTKLYPACCPHSVCPPELESNNL